MNPISKPAPFPATEPENTASSSEQTGLIPVLPEDEEETEAYEELYPFHLPRKIRH